MRTAPQPAAQSRRRQPLGPGSGRLRGGTREPSRGDQGRPECPLPPEPCGDPRSGGRRAEGSAAWGAGLTGRGRGRPDGRSRAETDGFLGLGHTGRALGTGPGPLRRPGTSRHLRERAVTTGGRLRPERRPTRPCAQLGGGAHARAGRRGAHAQPDLRCGPARWAARSPRSPGCRAPGAARCWPPAGGRCPSG